MDCPSPISTFSGVWFLGQASPIAGLPSFFELLAATSTASPRTLTPRWWLAAKYAPLLRDADGLAWELRGPGVECRTEEHRLTSSGKTLQTGKSSPVAARWADNMTDGYTELGQKAPIFAELRGLMDLAVVGALLSHEQLYDRCGWSLPTLRDPEAVQLSEFAAPATVPSLANLAQLRGGVAVSVSGGVEIDPSGIIDQSEEVPTMEATRRLSAPVTASRWWWD